MRLSLRDPRYPIETVEQIFRMLGRGVMRVIKGGEESSLRSP